VIVGNSWTHNSINWNHLFTHWFTNILAELNSCHKINSSCWRESKCFEVSKQIPDSSFDLKCWKDIMITWAPGKSNHVVHKFQCVKVLYELNLQLYGAGPFSINKYLPNWSWYSPLLWTTKVHYPVQKIQLLEPILRQFRIQSISLLFLKNSL
jgi:hypothetical protein